jgi:hypothetical protein
MSSNALEARTLLRIEKKLDELLRLTKTEITATRGAPMLQQMSFNKQVCPLCNKPIEYFVSEPSGDFGKVVRRECGCVPPNHNEETDNG